MLSPDTDLGGEDLGEFPLLIAFEKKVAVFRACASSLEEGRHKQGRVFACPKSCQMAKKLSLYRELSE